MAAAVYASSFVLAELVACASVELAAQYLAAWRRRDDAATCRTRVAWWTRSPDGPTRARQRPRQRGAVASRGPAVAPGALRGAVRRRPPRRAEGGGAGRRASRSWTSAPCRSDPGNRLTIPGSSPLPEVDGSRRCCRRPPTCAPCAAWARQSRRSGAARLGKWMAFEDSAHPMAAAGLGARPRRPPEVEVAGCAAVGPNGAARGRRPRSHGRRSTRRAGSACRGVVAFFSPEKRLAARGEVGAGASASCRRPTPRAAASLSAHGGPPPSRRSLPQ